MADDIAQWLKTLGLDQYARTFAENDIDHSVLPHLSDADLASLGVSLGHRRKLQAAIAANDVGVRRSRVAELEKLSPKIVTAAGERRQVSIVFIDLSGFTELSAKTDPEDVHNLLSRYFEIVDRVLLDHGGHIDKHIGDAVMGIFGAPMSHGNDTERAVRSAIAIQTALNKFSDDLGSKISAHIGIAAGEVVASETGSTDYREYTVIGESVNLAARLVSFAGPKEILMSEGVRREVISIAECEFRGHFPVKGFDRPISVWRLDAVRDDASQENLARPIVGRQSELAQFTAIMDVCRGARAEQLLLVRGEAGIGKTRLVEEFRRIAQNSGWHIHTVRVVDFGGGKDRDALAALTLSLLDLSVGATDLARKAIVEFVVEPSLDVSETVALYDLAQVGLPPELRNANEALNATKRTRGKRGMISWLVKRESAHAPLLIVIEDVHWADLETIDHLASIVSDLRDCPVVVTLTTRADGDPIGQAWRGKAQAAAFNTIDLLPLRKADAIALARNIGVTVENTVSECVERAEGNPLFLEQLLREALEGSVGSLPGSIQSVILMRMDRLLPKDKEALQAASVLGQRFNLEALRHLLDGSDYDPSPLVGSFLIRPDDDGYVFAHALIKDGAYMSLLKPRRSALHRLAGEWYGGKDAVLAAEHLDRAGDRSAPHAYLQAARTQMRSFRHEQALKLAERGVELCADRTTLVALHCCCGDALNALGTIDRSIDGYSSALSFAETDVERCAAWLGIVAGMRITDRTEEALDVLDQAQAAATSSNLTFELSQIHHVRGNILFPIGDIDACLKQHELSLKYAREGGSVENEARALGGLGDAYLQRGRMITADSHYVRCAHLAAENGLFAIESANLPQRGWTLLFQNKLARGLEMGMAGIKQSVKIGHRRAEVVSRFTVATLLHEMGRPAESQDQVYSGLAAARQLGMRRFEVVLLYLQTWLLFDQARIDEAVQTCQHATTIFQETGDFFAGARVLGIKALLASDEDQRKTHLAAGQELLSKRAHGINALYFCRDAIEVSLMAKQWDEVLRYADFLERFCQPEPLPWSSFWAARGRALADHGRGQGDRDKSLAELRRLSKWAEQAHLHRATSALNAALGE